MPDFLVTILMTLVVIGAVFIAVIAIMLSVASAKDAEKRDAVRAIVQSHRNAVVRQHFMLVTKDAYGVAETKKWDKEIKLFAERVVLPSVEPGRMLSSGLHGMVKTIVNETVVPQVAELTASLAFDPEMSPAMFEKWCADRLSDAGWQARVTSLSGDQGADVIAERGDLTVVVQCKLYAKPVGNKAVQEAHSARSHYRASHAAVVSNTGYTPHAKGLASTTGVHLLHVSDLPRLHDILALESPQIV